MSKPDRSKSETAKSETAKSEASEPTPFTPFADGATVRSVGALTFENGPDRIAVHGDLDITRDARGLAHARLLKATLDAIVSVLEAGDLPETVAEADDIPPKSVRNPFA